MFKQIFAITGMNLRSVPERWGPSLVIVIGLAGVVAVFTALLAMAQGFASTLQSAGRADNAIVLRGQSGAELNSGFGRDSMELITLGPGIRKGADGRPLAAGEMMVITELQKQDDPDPKAVANVTLRGVQPASFAIRPQLQVVAGRAFEPGKREVIIGAGVARQFAGTDLGDTLRMRGSDWTVVGHFEAGDANDSEIWVDLETAQSAFNRSGVSSVRVALESPAAIETLRAALAADPRLAVDVTAEQAYYSAQTRGVRQTIEALAFAVTFIMGLGAIFAALNTMYAAVSVRTREIATLRAIGFGGFPVLVSVMIEAVLLALAGGAIGAALAYLLFNGLSVSTLSQASFTQVVFAFEVTPSLVATGLVIAVVIGFIGGLLPAVRAARMQVTTALRTQ